MENEGLFRVLVVFLCFVNSVYIGKNEEMVSKEDYLLLRIGMFFTVIADFFLILTVRYTIGLASFCVVQLVYSIRYWGYKIINKELIIGLAVFVMTAIFTKMNFILSFGALYAVFLLFSVSGSIICYRTRPYPTNILVSLGMVLFLLCDICVLSYNTVFLSDPSMGPLIFRLIWLFYLPSQALLSSSGRIAKKKEE